MLSKLFETKSVELPHLIPGDRADNNFAHRYPLQVLIAEDNYTNRRLLVLLLTTLGYDVQATENGADCLRVARAGSFDVLLTDVNMPEMSGIDVAAALRRAGSQIPIIGITASLPELTRDQCFAAGMNGYLNKPVNLAEIKAVLKEIALRKWIEERNLATLQT